MDTKFIFAAFAIVALLVLAVLFRYKGTGQAEFSIFKWLTFRFKGSNQSSKEISQKVGVKVETGAQFTANEVVGRDKITNIYGTPSEKKKALSQSLHARLKFLDDINENSNADELEEKVNELIKFIRGLQLNSYAAEEIAKLTTRPGKLYYDYDEDNDFIGGQGGEGEDYNQRYRNQLISSRSKIRELIDELIQLH